ncbi:MAG TPA: rhomboid family intramembrane serine protease [Patescibacteria group bacterium]|nr:rhomboid family intramembrane serine protease [Patescibacteria group bacterium]
MLIIPLHKKPTLATFPWITALLVLVNVVVYFALQVPDDQRHARVVAAYADSRLAAIELPAYRAYIERTPSISWRARWERLPEPTRTRVLAMQVHGDHVFLAELRGDRVITPDQGEYREWKAMRAQFDATWRPSFTERHLLRQSEVDPARLFSSMFLHGDGAHLIGNMVFLVILGLVVEPVLGSVGFLLLYLLAGLGGGLFSLGWRWGDSGGLLGASGAIAGLMGAFAVLWGQRRVRLFYWFFVIFDYTRVRALWLLPIWFGWEFLQLLMSPDAGVGFDAHAGGILSGAALAFAATKLGRVNLAYLDEEDIRDHRVDELAAGLAELGKLQLSAARSRFDALVQRHPDDPAVIEPWLRSWLFAKERPEATAAVTHALSWRARHRADAQRQQRWFGEAVKAHAPKLPASADTLTALAARWQPLGLLAEAHALLATVEAAEPDHAALAMAWFKLALAHQEQRDDAAARRVLQHLRQRHPQSAEAGKAGLLLG